MSPPITIDCSHQGTTLGKRPLRTKGEKNELFALPATSLQQEERMRNFLLMCIILGSFGCGMSTNLLWENDADSDSGGNGDPDSGDDTDAGGDADADGDTESDGDVSLLTCDETVGRSSPYCEEEGVRCSLSAGGCCECSDFDDCGLWWDCWFATSYPNSESCPNQLPIDGARCPEEGIFCSYCSDGSPRRFYCGPDGFWDFRPWEVDCTDTECFDDDDCVVALHEDRCCQATSLATSRSALEADPCLTELGMPRATDTEECTDIIFCATCGSSNRNRYYSARCDGGQCVGEEDFCVTDQTMDSAAVLDAVDFEDPEEAGRLIETYRGQIVTVTGRPLLGPYSPDCSPAWPTDCTETPVDWTLGCQVILRGSVCSQSWECEGTECDPQCAFFGLDRASSYTAQGYLVDSYNSGYLEFELWPLHGTDDCAPLGPNPEGGTCEPFSPDHGCEEGLICYYWADEASLCDGTCRQPGTMCTPETQEEDCPEGDVCYEGYCEWCCPG